MLLICENQIYCPFIFIWFLEVKGNYVETKYDSVYLVQEWQIPLEGKTVGGWLNLSYIGRWCPCFKVTLKTDNILSFKTFADVYDMLQVFMAWWLLTNN